jgi:putative peptidoglycan lipid II flippase
MPSMEKRQNASLTKSAGLIGFLTFLSRVFGFLRDAAMAWFLGAGFVSDAFLVAFRIPNFLRKLFADGSLNLAFVPIFIEYLNQGRDEAFLLARSALRTVLLVLSLASAAGIVFAPALVVFFAPGFAESPEKMALTVSLTRIMFPFVVFIGLSAVCMGVLNTFGHFFAPSVAPLVINVSMIGGIFFLSPRMSEPVNGLAAGVIIGAVLQLVLHAPFLVKTGFSFWKKARLFHPALKKIGLLTLPAALGASVFQINVLLDTLIASFLSEGSISYLYYADRLVQFPLGIFAMAAAIALLPRLSREAAVKDYDGLSNTLVSSLNAVLFVTIPSMAGLIVLRAPIVSLLFERGEFDAASVASTAGALLYYGLGLWAFSGARIVVSTFYALRDARTPVRVALFAIFAKIVLSLVLVRFLDYKGLALATSAASVLNLLVLARALEAKLGGIVRWNEVIGSSMRTLGATFVMGAIISMLNLYLSPTVHDGFLAKAAGLSACILTGIVVFVAFSALFIRGELKIFVEAATGSRRTRY